MNRLPAAAGSLFSFQRETREAPGKQLAHFGTMH